MKLVVTIFIIISACSSIIGALYLTSPMNSDPYRAPFTRRFFKGELVRVSELNLGINSFYIAGLDRKNIYLGNSTAPFHLLTTSLNLLDSQHTTIKIKLDSIISPKQFKLKVDSPYFYLFHGGMPEYLRGDLQDLTAIRYLGDSIQYSVSAVPADRKTVIIKYYDSNTKSYEIGLLKSDGLRKQNKNLLSRQIDGIFCLDGMLLKDTKTKNLIHFLFYRNEIIVFDSSLNLIKKMTTIDTFSHARIKIANLNEGRESMITSRPVVLNTNGSAEENLLFIQSKLLSDKEDLNRFETDATIDTYNLSTGKYIGSFYIPQEKEEGVRNIATNTEFLFTLQGNKLIKYRLPREILRDQRTRENQELSPNNLTKKK